MDIDFIAVLRLHLDEAVEVDLGLVYVFWLFLSLRMSEMSKVAVLLRTEHL